MIPIFLMMTIKIDVPLGFVISQIFLYASTQPSFCLHSPGVLGSFEIVVSVLTNARALKLHEAYGMVIRQT